MTGLPVADRAAGIVAAPTAIRAGRSATPSPRIRSGAGVVDATVETLPVRAISSTVAVDRATGAARWEAPLDVSLQDGTYVPESAWP